MGAGEHVARRQDGAQRRATDALLATAPAPADPGEKGVRYCQQPPPPRARSVLDIAATRIDFIWRVHDALE